MGVLCFQFRILMMQLKSVLVMLTCLMLIMLIWGDGLLIFADVSVTADARPTLTCVGDFVSYD